MRMMGPLGRLASLILLVCVGANNALAQYAGGSGTSVDPFRIADASHFQNIADNPSAVFKLVGDITVTAFTGVEFSGELHGNNHAIQVDITAAGTDFNGLFRRLTGAAVVRDIRFTGQLNLNNVLFTGLIAADMDGGLIENVHSRVDIDVTGNRHDVNTGSGVGGLVARKNGGVIRGSSNLGLVRGNLDIGGLASLNWGGSIETSFYAGTVWATGANGAGGIVSNNRATISDVYSIGTVTGGNTGNYCFNCGGLIGVMSQGSVSRAYTTGQVISTDSLAGALIGQVAGTPSLSALFFDSDTSLLSQGAGGTGGGTLAGAGRTTAQMKDPATFNGAEWDFISTWLIASDEDVQAISYPYLGAFSYDEFDRVVAENPAPGLVGPARRFVIQGSASQVAGEGQPLTLRAHDVRDQLVALYHGNQAVTFSGADPAPNGTEPVIIDRLTQPRPFGEPVELDFFEGVAEASDEINGQLLMFEAGSVTLTATADHMVTESGDGLAVIVQPAKVVRFELDLTSPQINATAFTGINKLSAFDGFSNLATNFDASTNPVTLLSQAGGELSGLTGRGDAVLDQPDDFDLGVLDLSGRLVYTGLVSNGGVLAVSRDGPEGVSGPIQILAGSPASLTPESGDGQVAKVGEILPTAPRVLLADISGNPVRDVDVMFEVLAGGGSITGESVSSDTDGLAAVGSWTLGTVAGSQVLKASTAGLETSFSATASPDVPSQIQIQFGDDQRAEVATAVPVAPVVRVGDQFDNPVPGVEVSFTVVLGGGQVSVAAVSTDGSGLAELTAWTLGEQVGENQLRAEVGDHSVLFTATGTVAAASSMVIEAGDGQSAFKGTMLAVAPAVRIEDAFGNPVPGITVNFVVTAGGGQIEPPQVMTDEHGLARASSWTLGDRPGVNTLTVTANEEGLLEVNFSATALPDVIFSDGFR